MIAASSPLLTHGSSSLTRSAHVDGIGDVLKRVTLKELHADLTRYLRLVRRGESIEIVEGSVPVVRISPITRAVEDAGSSIQESLPSASVVPPRKRLDARFFARRPIPCRGDIVRALLDDRNAR
jgi:antitoxin (DNA-binding transcriptional repressor) of toxin-antitoxin stability system